VKYVIISAGCASELVVKVQEKLDEAYWEPLGGMIVIPIPGGCVEHYQTLILHDDK
jgi:hypothetical protein